MNANGPIPDFLEQAHAEVEELWIEAYRRRPSGYYRRGVADGLYRALEVLVDALAERDAVVAYTRSLPPGTVFSPADGEEEER